MDGRWRYLYRAINNSGALVDVLFSERCDTAAVRAFFRSARAAIGTIPDRITTDDHDHDSYPRAIRAGLGEPVRHHTSRYKNNVLEQDYRPIKDRYRPMRGFKCPRSAARVAAATMSSATFCTFVPTTTGTSPPPAASCFSCDGR